MHPHHDESFILSAPMPAYYYRGAHGQALRPAPLDGLGGAVSISVDDSVIVKFLALGGILAGSAIAYAGWSSLSKAEGKQKLNFLPLILAGFGVAYMAGRKL